MAQSEDIVIRIKVGNEMVERHPSVTQILRYFEFRHLSGPLRSVSMPFYHMAYKLVRDERLHGPELTVALRKLLEAKDAAVRAAL